MLRTVSEAPRPHEGGDGSATKKLWPRWFRYGAMKEASPGLARNCYGFCFNDGGREGWDWDIAKAKRCDGRGLAGVDRDGEEPKGRWEDSRCAGRESDHGGIARL